MDDGVTDPEEDLFPRVAFLAVFPSSRDELYEADGVSIDRSGEEGRLT